MAYTLKFIAFKNFRMFSKHLKTLFAFEALADDRRCFIFVDSGDFPEGSLRKTSLAEWQGKMKDAISTVLKSH